MTLQYHFDRPATTMSRPTATATIAITASRCEDDGFLQGKSVSRPQCHRLVHVALLSVAKDYHTAYKKYLPRRIMENVELQLWRALYFQQAADPLTVNSCMLHFRPPPNVAEGAASLLMLTLYQHDATMDEYDDLYRILEYRFHGQFGYAGWWQYDSWWFSPTTLPASNEWWEEDWNKSPTQVRISAAMDDLRKRFEDVHPEIAASRHLDNIWFNIEKQLWKTLFLYIKYSKKTLLEKKQYVEETMLPELLAALVYFVKRKYRFTLQSDSTNAQSALILNSLYQDGKTKWCLRTILKRERVERKRAKEEQQLCLLFMSWVKLYQ